MYIKDISFACRDSPVVRRYVPSPGAIDAFTVTFQPFPHFLQPLHRCSRQPAIRLRTDIQQEIGIPACRPHKIPYQCFSGFVILVCDLISPHSVHCLAGLQRKAADTLIPGISGGILSREIPFKDLDIFTFKRHKMMIVPYKA